MNDYDDEIQSRLIIKKTGNKEYDIKYQFAYKGKAIEIELAGTQIIDLIEAVSKGITENLGLDDDGCKDYLAGKILSPNVFENDANFDDLIIKSFNMDEINKAIKEGRV